MAPRNTKTRRVSAEAVPGADARALRRAVTDLARAVMFRDRTRVCCHGVSVTQSYALAAIVRRGRMTQNDLAGELSLDKSTASRIAASLERLDYVRRTAKPEDGRAVVLSPTRKGRELLARMEREDEIEMDRLARDLPPASRRVAARLIGRVARMVSRKYS